MEELDERHFINTDTRLQTPLKLSPFARNGHRYMPPATPKKITNDDQSDVVDSGKLEPPLKRQQL